jgi:fimbrial chaperone protein
MRLKRVAVATPLLGLLLATTADQAGAATFSVSPIRVELDAAHHTSILTLNNSGHEMLRMQVRAMHWAMAPDGSWQLTPSDDLIATPELLEVAPGDSMQLRIGSMEEPGTTEASYRLLIDELPNLSEEAGAHKPLVKVLTQVSLPVYLEPAQPKRDPVLRSATIEGGTLMLGIGNEGTQRLDAQGAQVILTDNAGHVIARRDQTTNYVLAGSTDTLRMKLPSPLCAKAASVTLAWPGMAGVSLTHPISRGGDPCGGAGLH